VVLTPRIIGLPEEPSPVPPKLEMDSFPQKVHSHSMEGKVGQASIDQCQASRRGHEFLHPRVRPPTNPKSKWTPIHSCNGPIANGQAQVSEGKRSQLTVEHISNSLVGGSQYHDLTFVEIDTESGHILKA
jgi:hypothetical protein